MTAALWTLSLAAPAVAALVIAGLSISASVGTRAIRRGVVAWAPLPVLLGAVVAAVADTGDVLRLPWLLLGVELQLDAIGRPLFFMASLLYAAALVAVHAARTAGEGRLTFLMLTSYLGNAVVFVAADAATFYAAFAVMSLSAYGLVVHERTRSAVRAGRVYIVLTMVSELFVLAAVVLVVAAGGLLLDDAPAAVAASGHTALIVALLVVGFGIKAGTVPLHVWLPLAHPAAPPPASAVLSGAMIKAGLVGWLRFLPLGELALPGWGTTLIVLALVGAFAALPAGVLQRDAKVALAYSSISQMGFLAVLVGTALAVPELAAACTLAAVVYAVHHGIAKGALFLGVTVWRTHTGRWVRRWVVAVLVLAGLAVAGAPFGSGAVAKYASKEALETTAVLGVELIDLLPLVGTVSTLLVARFLHLLLTGSREGAWGVDGALVQWTVLVLVGTVLTWFVAGAAAPVVEVPDLEPVTVWEATWPVLLGLTIAAAVWFADRHGLVPSAVRRELVPPGDLLVAEVAVVRRSLAAGRRAERRARSALRRPLEAGPDLAGRAARRAAGFSDLLERRLERWQGAGLAVLGVAAVLALLAWWSR